MLHPITGIWAAARMPAARRCRAEAERARIRIPAGHGALMGRVIGWLVATSSGSSCLIHASVGASGVTPDHSHPSRVRCSVRVTAPANHSPAQPAVARCRRAPQPVRARPSTRTSGGLEVRLQALEHLRRVREVEVPAQPDGEVRGGGEAAQGRRSRRRSAVASSSASASALGQGDARARLQPGEGALGQVGVGDLGGPGSALTSPRAGERLQRLVVAPRLRGDPALLVGRAGGRGQPGRPEPARRSCVSIAASASPSASNASAVAFSVSPRTSSSFTDGWWSGTCP